MGPKVASSPGATLHCSSTLAHVVLGINNPFRILTQLGMPWLHCPLLYWHLGAGMTGSPYALAT